MEDETQHLDSQMESININANGNDSAIASQQQQSSSRPIKLWKTQKKNLKLKDTEKKIQGLRYCIEDQRFFREPEVFPLVISFLSRVKVPELLIETLETFSVLLNNTSLEKVTDQHDIISIEGEEVKAQSNALFILNKLEDSQLKSKCGESFIRLFTANVPSEVKVKAIQVYQNLLKHCANEARNSGKSTSLIAFATIGSPLKELISCLDVSDHNLLHTALHCIAKIFYCCTCIVKELLQICEKENGIGKVLTAISDSEMNIKITILEVLDSISQSKQGRNLLRRSKAVQDITDLLQNLSGSTKGNAGISSPIENPNTSSSADLLEANKGDYNSGSIPLMCSILVRLQLADNVVHEEDSHEGQLMRSMLAAMVSVLQRDVKWMLDFMDQRTDENNPGVPDIKKSKKTSNSETSVKTEQNPLLGTNCATVIICIGRIVENSKQYKMAIKEKNILHVLVSCLRISGEFKLHKVADRLLHILGFDDKQNKITDPRLFCPLNTEKAVANSTSETFSSNEDNFAPYLSIDYVLKTLDDATANGNFQLQYRLVRWFATVFTAKENANAVGEVGMRSIIGILETIPLNSVIMVGLLSQCIEALCSSCPEAYDVCGSDRWCPPKVLFQFLWHKVSLDCTPVISSLDIKNTYSPTTDSTNRDDESLYNIQTWGDEDLEGKIFECPCRITMDVNASNAHLWCARALRALAMGFNIWNINENRTLVETANNSVDFLEIIKRKEESNSKVGGLSHAKKKSDKTSSNYCANTAGYILERALDLLVLIEKWLPTRHEEISLNLLHTYNELVKLPSGINALLYLNYSEFDDEYNTFQVGHDPTTADDNTRNPNSDWLMSVEDCLKSKHAKLLRPIIAVLSSDGVNFFQLEITIQILYQLCLGSNTTNAIVEATKIKIPIAQSDLFISAGISMGAMVLLIALLDTSRLLSNKILDDRQENFIIQVQTLLIEFCTLGQKKQHIFDETALTQAVDTKSELSQENENDKPLPLDPLYYTNQWATNMLEQSHDAFGYDQYSPLLIATEIGLTNIAKYIVSARTPPNKTLQNGISALMLAYLNGNEELITVLLEAKADVDAITSDGTDLSVWSCVLVAPSGEALNKTISTAHGQLLTGEVPIETLMEMDFVTGSPKGLNLCLKNGLDPNVSDGSGYFLLHRLVSYSILRKRIRGLDLCFRYKSTVVDLRILYSLVESVIDVYKANINACNKYGQTALHLAFLYGHLEIANLLLDRKCHTNVQDMYGCLPLHYACLGLMSGANNDTDRVLNTIKKLLLCSTKCNLYEGKHEDKRKHKSPHEKRVMEIENVLEQGYSEIYSPASIMSRLATTEEVLSTKTNIHGLNPWHFTCGGFIQLESALCLDDDMLHGFYKNGSTRASILELLVREFNININESNKQGMNALHFALKSDHYECNLPVINALLDFDIEVNAVHDHIQMDYCYPIPEKSYVKIRNCSDDREDVKGYVSFRSLEHTYDIVLSDGSLMCNVRRPDIQPLDMSSPTELNPLTIFPYKSWVESMCAPLHYALQKSDTLSMLLLQRPNISLVPERCDLPFFSLACAARRSASIIERLINAQVNVRVQLPLYTGNQEFIDHNISKQSAGLHYSVMYEDLDATRTILANSEYTNVNVRRSGDGFTPVHLACEIGNIQLIKLLVDHGSSLIMPSTVLTMHSTRTTPLELLNHSDDYQCTCLKELIQDKYITYDMLLQSIPMDQESEQTCILCLEEEHNYEIAQQYHNHLNIGQSSNEILIKLKVDLSKSDNILAIYYQMISEGQTSENLREKHADLQYIRLEDAQRCHECYASSITYSKWANIM